MTVINWSNFIICILQFVLLRADLAEGDFFASWPGVRLQMVLSRRWIQYVLEGLLPVFLISFLNTTAFLLPPECGERVRNRQLDCFCLKFHIWKELSHTLFATILVNVGAIHSDYVIQAQRALCLAPPFDEPFVAWLCLCCESPQIVVKVANGKISL